jgi:phosphopantothenate---cysteine ligase (CTP)
LNCIVTAGPTFEPLDEVRRLTNFSTGTLGAGLANYLVTQGHHVTLLKGYYAVHPGQVHAHTVTEFTTTADLAERLQVHAGPRCDAVFHVAAVSDFSFGRVFARNHAGELVEVKSGKFSTKAGALYAELTPTPKIIASLRSWFQGAYVVGWKYEVEGTRADAIAEGLDQLQRCDTDACVVNGPAYGEGFGFVAREAEVLHLKNAASLYETLALSAVRRAAGRAE